MSNDTDHIDPTADEAPTAQDDATSLDEVPAVAGGTDDQDPEQGEGETSSF